MNPDSASPDPIAPANADTAAAPKGGRVLLTLALWVGAFALAASAFFGAGVYAKSRDMASVEAVCQEDGFNAEICACVRRQAEQSSDLSHYLPLADRFMTVDEQASARQSARALQLCIGNRQQASPWMDRAMAAGGAS